MYGMAQHRFRRKWLFTGHFCGRFGRCNIYFLQMRSKAWSVFDVSMYVMAWHRFRRHCSWAVKGCGWSNEIETIARSALPPAPILNPANAGSSASLGVALTIGEALNVEQEPLEPPPFRRTARPGRWDVTGVSSSSSHSCSNTHSSHVPPPFSTEPFLKPTGRCESGLFIAKFLLRFLGGRSGVLWAISMSFCCNFW